MNKSLIWILIVIGIVYRLIISWDGNFIFNMDNARDMVDVREMVVLGKWRLIGQTTAIDGFFYGPIWYYLLSVPFILSGGNPYGSILLEIFLWAIGGYFLFFLVDKYYGKLALFSTSFLWIASNFILLGSQYAFNPNPILFLTPVFIFVLLKYLETKNSFYNILAWFLGGLFFQFEVTVGLFMPAVILLSIIFSKNSRLFKNIYFYLGPLIFIVVQLPQIIFELRHNFFMTKSLLVYQSISHGQVVAIPALRFSAILRSFYDTFLPTLMNFQFFTNVVIILFIGCLLWALKKKDFLKEKLTLISFLLVAVPLIGLIPLKVDLMRWHLNAAVVAGIILVGFVIHTLSRSLMGKILAVILTLMLFIFTVKNVSEYLAAAKKGEPGNSILRNELAAIDYVYQEAQGKNFKVYVYLPSVIDYPYQYLFWWHGLKKYGYVPQDYAYSPGKPPYIKQKERLDTGSRRINSALVFLIKEPDQIGQRHLWENQFKSLPLLQSTKIGAIEIEKRTEISLP